LLISYAAIHVSIPYILIARFVDSVSFIMFGMFVLVQCLAATGTK
jgi:hypothetical protein